MFSGTPSWTAEDPWTNGTRLVDILRAPSYLCSDWKQPYSIHTVSELTQLLLRFCVFFYSCCVFKGKPYFSTLSILHYLCMTCMFGVRLKAEQAEIPPKIFVFYFSEQNGKNIKGIWSMKFTWMQHYFIFSSCKCEADFILFYNSSLLLYFVIWIDILGGNVIKVLRNT